MTAQYRWFPQLWKGVSAHRVLRLLCLVWKRKTKVMSATSISVVCNLLGLRLHQTLFVGSITVVEGHWMGHAEGLSHGFWLGFTKILVFFPSS
jgi:hypothetical protein